MTVRKKLLSTTEVLKTKLKPRLLLQPFLHEFKYLNEMSEFTTHWSKNTKLEIVAFLADAPCRAQFLEVMQFNANDPCHRCHIKRENNLIPIFKHKDLELKHKNDVVKYAQELANYNQNPRHSSHNNPIYKDHINGVKGLSLLSCFNFNFILRTPVESEGYQQ